MHPSRLQWIDNINEDIKSIGLTLRGAMDLTKGNGDHSFQPIAAKWLSLGTDDDDDNDDDNNYKVIHVYIINSSEHN